MALKEPWVVSASTLHANNSLISALRPWGAFATVWIHPRCGMGPLVVRLGIKVLSRQTWLTLALTQRSHSLRYPKPWGATLVIGHRLADNPTAEDILGLHRNERSCLSCNPQFRTLLNLGSTPTSPLVTVPASVNATNHEHRVLAIA